MQLRQFIKRWGNKPVFAKFYLCSGPDRDGVPTAMYAE